MKKGILAIAALVLAIATTTFAQLSMEKADWARGPVQFLMTPEEKAQWNNVKTDAEADKFIALFWARRDPTPNTPQNEFRQDFEQRVAFADKNFGGTRQRGSLTDRGKILILFGSPTKALRAAPTASGQFGHPTDTETSGSEEVTGERQTWIYEGPEAQKLFGTAHVEFQFVDRLNNHDMRLQPPRVDLTAAQQRVIQAEIFQPNLTEPPTYRQPQPAKQTAPAAPAGPVTTLKTASLETAVAEPTKAPAKGAIFTDAEFLSPMGEYYVPAGLYIPASSGITADSADTFFGVVNDATGKRVLAFEEPAKLTPSKDSFLADHTLELPTGKYTAVVGLAKAGAPVLMVSAPIEVTALTKEATGTSKLILSNDIQTTTEQAPIKTPFAFGQLKIIPKADSVFTNKDDLNYFVELHNPGIDPATNGPKLQMKMEIDKIEKGKDQPVAGAPLSDVPAAPLSGQPGAGEYAIVNGIPLGQMSKPLAPGDYIFKMKIVDTVSKQSYNLEQKFKIAA